jgi:hypothetical protein
MRFSIFDSNASDLSIQSAMKVYAHAMQALVLSQMSSLDLSQDHDISDRDSDNVPISGVLCQGPVPPPSS